METSVKFIQGLAAKGVNFSCTHPSPGGLCSIVIDPSMLMAYYEDPAEVIASYYGVKKEEYLGWVTSGFCVRCAGITAKGQSCQNITENGVLCSPDQWVAEHGKFCYLHRRKWGQCIQQY